MKTKNEISKELGVSRQMLHGVVTGSFNCSYDTAKAFDLLFGGGVEVWIYPNNDQRRRLFEQYRRGTK